jgi:hypothetical protein
MRAGGPQDGNVTGPNGFCCLAAASGFEPLPSGRDIILLGHCNSQLGDSAVGQYSARWRCRIRAGAAPRRTAAGGPFKLIDFPNHSAMRPYLFLWSSSLAAHGLSA